MADDTPKKVVDVVPVMTKITEHKLGSSNYLDWRQTIELYLLSVSMDTHMTDDPPSAAASKLSWLRDYARLFLQIRNSIDSDVIGMVTHCRTVKTLQVYLEFLYSGKGNISRMYTVCQEFYRPEKGDKSLTDYFMLFKRTYEELNTLLPFSPNVKVQCAQRDTLRLMSFLAGLPPEFDTAKSQVLSDSTTSSLEDAFRRILRTEPTASPPMSQSAFLSSSSPSDYEKALSKGGGGPSGHRKQWTDDVECRYCHAIGHIKRDYPKLKNRRVTSAHVVSSC
ncbi:hypothetical protein C2S52_009017 [Perilla frutescens var. hirtella]|nr:hypothetical protein C2S52_009017 [Perilla frutescens var. hirtella]